MTATQRKTLAVVGALTFALTVFAAAQPGHEVDPTSALQEGNRLFRDGRVDEAIERYLAGYSPDAPHPTLVYNLGAAYHRLDRLPEAILWYRRASDSEDPWLQENLWLARRALGTQNLPPAGVLGWLTRSRQELRLAAVAVAWLTLIVLLAPSRLPRWVLLAGALLAASLYGTAGAAERWGPRAAVLMQDCHTLAGELPAGTETWVTPTFDGRWRVAASSDVVCPAESVGLVDLRD